MIYLLTSSFKALLALNAGAFFEWPVLETIASINSALFIQKIFLSPKIKSFVICYTQFIKKRQYVNILLTKRVFNDIIMSRKKRTE